MFTGIVETVATVKARKNGGLVIAPVKSKRGLTPFGQKESDPLRVGESVAVDGVCLTVERLEANQIHFRLLPETKRVSTLGRLKAGDRVNLERSLRAGDRLGGHLLLGHVDGRGRVVRQIASKGSLTLEIQLPHPLISSLVPKGPIAIDGVSLTLDPKIQKDRIQVHLVSHTLTVTNLSRKGRGAWVNIELDLIVKYLRGILKLP